MIRRALVGTLTAALSALLAPAPMAEAGPALLFDAGTGRVLYAEDQDDYWHPASLTKIMTAYVVFEAIKSGKLTMDGKLPVSELAHSQSPSKLGLPVGAELSVGNALQALIVKSANDVAVMLAEGVAGTHEAFVERMNEAAQRLGMTRTRFANANGLPAAEQVTTARDLAKLSRAAVKDFPEHAGLWSQFDARIGKIRLRTHNGLLRTYDGADGIKTGFICDSGYNVVASATRDSRRLIAVVLGEANGRDRSIRAASLLEHGFQTLDWKTLLSSETIDTQPMAADAKGPITMRAAVRSFECGTRGRAVARAKKNNPIFPKQAGAKDAAPDPATAKKAAGKPKAPEAAAAVAPAQGSVSATPTAKRTAKGKAAANSSGEAQPPPAKQP